MFFKKIKNLSLILLLLATFPTYVRAYSNYLIPGGENIGIELNSNGVIIVGTYDVGLISPAKLSGLQSGDKIIKINDESIVNIEDMLNRIELSPNKENIKVTYLRGNREYTTTLSLSKDENNVYKTGLYVKDNITGVGTLTYIDPNTKMFGALGHEIIEKNTGQKLEIKDGKIYSSTVTGITRSDAGKPGEKNARYDSSLVFGNIALNTSKGLFGTYTSDIPNKKLMKVATLDEVNLGSAKMLTVIEGAKVEEFDINIIRINKDDSVTKNFLFEVTDETLVQESGGIVQGMSGSPIIQGNNIIGAVTHVVVDDPLKGYGISIVKMLEEAEN